MTLKHLALALVLFALVRNLLQAQVLAPDRSIALFVQQAWTHILDFLFSLSLKISIPSPPPAAIPLAFFPSFFRQLILHLGLASPRYSVSTPPSNVVKTVASLLTGHGKATELLQVLGWFSPSTRDNIIAQLCTGTRHFTQLSPSSGSLIRSTLEYTLIRTLSSEMTNSVQSQTCVIEVQFFNWLFILRQVGLSTLFLILVNTTGNWLAPYLWLGAFRLTRVILVGGNHTNGQNMDPSTTGTQEQVMQPSVESSRCNVHATIPGSPDHRQPPALLSDTKSNVDNVGKAAKTFHTPLYRNFPSLLAVTPPLELEQENDLFIEGIMEEDVEDVFKVRGKEKGKRKEEVTGEVERDAELVEVGSSGQVGTDSDNGDSSSSSSSAPRSPDPLKVALATLYISPTTPYSDVKTACRKSVYIPTTPEIDEFYSWTPTKGSKLGSNVAFIGQADSAAHAMNCEELGSRAKMPKQRRADGHTTNKIKTRDVFKHLTAQLQEVKLIPPQLFDSTPGPLTLGDVHRRIGRVELQLDNLLATWGYVAGLYEEDEEKEEEV